jgi:F-type H+-transporting ATPase subunit b
VSFEWGKIVKSINWTLVFNLINFAVLLYVLKRLLFKPAMEYLDRRRARIFERIKSARADEEQAAQLVTEQREALAEARKRAEQIGESAQREAESIIARAKDEARDQAKRILVEGERQLVQERDRMIAELRQAYAEITVLGAERVLDREIRIEDHRRLLDQLLEEIDEEGLRIGS